MIQFQRMKTLKKLTTAILLLIMTISLTEFTSASNSPDFEVTTTYNIYYNQGDDYVEVDEILEIRSNNPQYFLPSNGEKQFEIPDFNFSADSDEHQFKIESIKVTDRFGFEKEFSTEIHDGGITVNVPDNLDITYGTNYRLTLSYKTHELIDQNGNITNLYIPGLPEDIIFEETDSEFGVRTEYNYDAALIIPDSAPEASYIKPESIDINSVGDNKVYSFDQEQRIGTTGWIQLGTKQYYYFRLVQKAQKTDNIIPPEISQYSDLISTNVYKLPLPKEHDETDQQVFFKSITPEPAKIEKDKEGNLTAFFEVPANQESEIILEGYIALTNETGLEELPDIELSGYLESVREDQNLAQYTYPDKYWESDNNEVKSRAELLARDRTTLLDLVRADYNYVIDSLEYSYEKVNGDNQRLGALAALTGSQSVCMEYADATIALLRAQGVPARAAVGYGNDPTGAENAIGDDQALAQKIGHQWLQVWVPDYGWLSVDPTWGETGRTYIGGNLDHILWYTIGDSTQSFIGTSLNSADFVTDASLQAYDVYLRSLPEEEFPSEEELTPLSKVISDYENADYDKVSFFLKTNILGKAIVIIAPILFAFVLLLIISKGFLKIIRE